MLPFKLSKKLLFLSIDAIVVFGLTKAYSTKGHVIASNIILTAGLFCNYG